MGTGSSVQSSEKPETVEIKQRSRHKSVKLDFEKEFGNYSVEHKVEILEVHKEEAGPSGKLIGVNPAIFRAKRLFLSALNKRKTIQKKNLHVKKQSNSGLLREMYCRMDPSVNITSSLNIAGEIELAAKYKPLEKSLLLKIGRANNLSREDALSLPNPYVVVEMFEDSDRKVLRRQTTVKRNTSQPVFQEIVVFPLLEQQIAETKVQVIVLDEDVAVKDGFLGESVVELCKLDLFAGNSIWCKLHPQTDTSICGNIDISLSFMEPNIITVTVHEAHDIKACNTIEQISHPYVRLYATGIPNKLETKVKKSTVDPVWDESFEFNMHPDEFSRRTIVLNVLSKESAGVHDKRLGDVQIPLLDFKMEQSGVRRQYLLQDLKHTLHGRSKWSEEGLSMEFRESLRAHAIYGYPKFLFKKQHKGKKMVVVHSKKAKTEAKMVILNGAPDLDPLQL